MAVCVCHENDQVFVDGVMKGFCSPALIECFMYHYYLSKVLYVSLSYS